MLVAAAFAATSRVRNRKNRHGRRDGGNRCGHDPRRPRRVQRAKASLPKIIRIACERMGRVELPLLLGRAHRSELRELARTTGPVMMARTDVMSGRIGKPDRKDRRRWTGLSVDHDLAPLSGNGESRVERLIGSFFDWDWLHYEEVPAGRRNTKRVNSDGVRVVRCSSQQVEEKDGKHRGLAAIRVWTNEVWRWLGLMPALAEARLALKLAAERAIANKTVAVAPTVAATADSLSDPTSDARPPP